MRKSHEEKSESRAWAFANADLIEWQRQIENPALLSEVKRLQKQYKLPVKSSIKHISVKEVTDWMGYKEPITINETTGEIVLGEKGKRREKLENEIDELMTRFDIPPKFQNSLHRMVVMDIRSPEHQSMGFPEFNFYIAKNGKIIHQCIITPETDLGNPLVLDFIRQWQVLIIKDTIPRPLPTRENKKKLDWRPVWEWRKRHPDITIQEIADVLGYDRVTVNRALAHLDKEHVTKVR